MTARALGGPVVRAGLAYAAIVFSGGFVLGILRTLIIAPKLGDVTAVALEIPFLVVISWFVSRRVLRLLPVAAQAVPRLMMGGIALLAVFLFEAALSISLSGLTLRQHAELYATLPVQLGFLAQIFFASVPYLQIRSG